MTEPIIGPRFSCSNVQGIDICSVCATTPGQSFSSNKFKFEDMSWKIISSPVSSSPASTASVSTSSTAAGTSTYDENESDDGSQNWNTAAGKGATGRYFKDAPNADDYQDDKDFRKAMLDNTVKTMQARRALGSVGNKVANDYMSSLNKPPETE
jgi:hypothetical protein